MPLAAEGWNISEDAPALSGKRNKGRSESPPARTTRWFGTGNPQPSPLPPPPHPLPFPRQEYRTRGRRGQRARSRAWRTTKHLRPSSPRVTRQVHPAPAARWPLSPRVNTVPPALPPKKRTLMVAFISATVSSSVGNW